MVDIFSTTVSNALFINEKFCILIRISLKFVPCDPFNDKSTLVQIMARRQPGDKPLSELMMVSLLTHICVTRPQLINPLVVLGDVDVSNMSPQWCPGQHLLNVICLYLSREGSIQCDVDLEFDLKSESTEPKRITPPSTVFVEQNNHFPETAVLDRSVGKKVGYSRVHLTH